MESGIKYVLRVYSSLFILNFPNRGCVFLKRGNAFYHVTHLKTLIPL